MRVAILVDEMAPGSAPKLLGWPIRKLKELGVEAEAIVVIDRGYREKYPDLYQFHLGDIRIRYLLPTFPKWVQRWNFKFPGMSFFSLHHVASWFYAKRGVQEREFDLILAHCQYSAFAGRNLLLRRDIPFLLLLWDPSTFTAQKIYKNRFGWKYPFLRIAAAWLDRFALRKCRAVVTSGHFHHAHLKHLTSKPLEVLAPGCFVASQLPEFSQRERMMLTYDRWDIGNIPTVFLDLLQRLDRPDVKLVIGGFWHPASLREEFLKEVAARDLSSRVELLGPLDEQAIIRLCSKAMVHVHLVHEAFGMQTLEAAACGCPGLIPAGSGVAELFKHEVSGFHPPAGDLESAARCLQKLFDDPQRAQAMSRAAWEVAQSHDWGAHAKALKTILEKYT
jgi:glycosyltransferase involved in cell wall biosynthesis